MRDLNDQADPASTPTAVGVRAVVFDLLVYIVIPFLVPLGFLFATAAMVVPWRALRGASDRCARNYWRCSVAVHLLFAYAVLVLTLLAWDSLAGHAWQLASWWPSLSRWCGMDGEAQFLLLLDVAGVLVAALVLLVMARWYGQVDEANVWHPPRRLVRTGEAASFDTLPPDAPD